MQLFYAPDLAHGKCELSKEEARHCAKVLRKKSGDHIQLTDGKGNWYEATLSVVTPKFCSFELSKKTPNYQKRNYQLSIAIAPTKNISRYEWFLEKSTEIGINNIIPIICQQSERTIIKPERLNKVLLSAMKQSLKAYLPNLQPSENLKKWLQSTDWTQYPNRYIAHMGAETLLNKTYTPAQDALILIGPEGDFSKEEIAIAQEKGFQSISLGNSRLRTETAGVLACHTIYLANL